MMRLLTLKELDQRTPIKVEKDAHALLAGGFRCFLWPTIFGTCVDGVPMGIGLGWDKRDQETGTLLVFRLPETFPASALPDDVVAPISIRDLVQDDAGSDVLNDAIAFCLAPPATLVIEIEAGGKVELGLRIGQWDSWVTVDVGLLEGGITIDEAARYGDDEDEDG